MLVKSFRIKEKKEMKHQSEERFLLLTFIYGVDKSSVKCSVQFKPRSSTSLQNPAPLFKKSEVRVRANEIGMQ